MKIFLSVKPLNSDTQIQRLDNRIHYLALHNVLGQNILKMLGRRMTLRDEARVIRNLKDLGKHRKNKKQY